MRKIQHSAWHQTETPPPSSSVIHCLNGNLLRALIGFGKLADERVQQAIDWQVRSITGEGFTYYRSGTSGPGFCCSANERLPCAWGAIKALLALARIPVAQRTIHVTRAIEQGVSFLFSCDPATAAYPAGWGNMKPSQSWFKLGFANDARLANAVDWLLSKQDPSGRWKNQYAYNGKTWVDIDKQGEISKWVTLRACSVLKMVYS